MTNYDGENVFRFFFQVENQNVADYFDQLSSPIIYRLYSIE